TIHRAAGASTRIPGLPPTIRAAQLLDSNVQIPGGFLDLFGKPPRESACECERSSGLMLGPVLNLVNGPVLAEALKDPNNRLAKLVAAEKDDAKVVEELFYAFLCRPPSAKELAAGIRTIRGAKEEFDRQTAEYHLLVKQFEEYQKQVDGRQPAWEQSQKATVS